MTEKNIDIYIVICYRYGNAALHYIAGAYTDLTQANEACCKEHVYRGDKYNCHVLQTKLYEKWTEKIKRGFPDKYAKDLNTEIVITLPLNKIALLLDEELKYPSEYFYTSFICKNEDCRCYFHVYRCEEEVICPICKGEVEKR